MGIFSRSSRSSPVSICKTILIGGEAGDGIKSAGSIISLSLLKNNFEVFLYDEYPSLIRGGHNSVNITYSPYPVYSQNSEIDILICLNRETFDTHKANLNTNSIVIYDRSDFEFKEEDIQNYPCEIIDIATAELLQKYKLPKIVRNVIFTSVAVLITGVDKETLSAVMQHELHKKELVEANLKAIEVVYEDFYEYFNLRSFENLTKTKETQSKNRYFMSGNDAIALGAVHSGLQFYAAYPMTPATTILQTLISVYKEYNIIVKQVEDEIAAINMAIGASFAGARSMVGTSGGGFSLMVEGVGLAAITETPLVIAISQRPGPATGLPTWTEQADLLFVLNASQDEFPRIILTPTDVKEAFDMSFLALNLAEKYQLPVFILIDKYLSESFGVVTIDKDPKYKIDRGLLLNERILTRLDNFDRFELTNSGISPRSIPGQKNGIFLANSDEGDLKGYTNECSENRINKVEKRFRKMKGVINDLPQIDIYGNPKAKNGIICWGSTKGPVLEAIRRLGSTKSNFKVLALNYMEPFPKDMINSFIKKSKEVIVIEGNFTSQLSKLISQNSEYIIEKKFLKYDGRPFGPDEIVNYLQNIKK